MPTTDPTTTIGKIRLMIPDRGTTTSAGGGLWFAFSDEEIQAFHELEGNSLKRATALALETLASNDALVKGVTETLDLKVDGAKAAEAMLKRAKMLREQAAENDADNAFSVVEYGDLTVFNAIEYATKNGQFADGFDGFVIV
jgi:hypothetical protein